MGDRPGGGNGGDKDIAGELGKNRAKGNDVPNHPLENRNTQREVIERSGKSQAAVDAGVEGAERATGTDRVGGVGGGAVSTPATTSRLSGGTGAAGG